MKRRERTGVRGAQQRAGAGPAPTPGHLWIVYGALALVGIAIGVLALYVAASSFTVRGQVVSTPECVTTPELANQPLRRECRARVRYDDVSAIVDVGGADGGDPIDLVVDRTSGRILSAGTAANSRLFGIVMLSAGIGGGVLVTVQYVRSRRQAPPPRKLP